MRRLLRHGLAGMLSIALMAAGLPLSHAQGCITELPVAHEMTLHDATDATSHHADMMMDDEAAMAHAPAHPQHGPSATPCKCLNCSSLCAAFVAPLPHAASPQRRVVATRYALRVAALRDAALAIDPGIPIAA